MPGGIEYQLPVSLALLLFAALCASTQRSLHPSRALARALARALTLSLLGFAITGLHELAALMLVGAVLIGSVFVFLERRPNLGIWLTVLVLVAFGAAVSLLAPGNAERAATGFPHGRSISQGVVVLARRVLRWIDVKLLAASVLFALTFGSQLRASQNPPDRARVRMWATLLAGAAMLRGICWSTRSAGGGRWPTATSSWRRLPGWKGLQPLNIGPDAAFANNRLFAAYFGIRSVRVGDSPG